MPEKDFTGESLISFGRCSRRWLGEVLGPTLMNFAAMLITTFTGLMISLAPSKL